jgi:hypothetical protein
MGSGAFLVECCRQLADEVVSAWGRAHEVEEIAADCPGGDVVAHARRLVAQRCLYGVDKNAMAVQLAKLSLWLFTLARELPFTFLDHSFRHGDSLVGLDLEQIKAFHWKPENQLSFLSVEIKRALDEVVAIRQDIHKLAGDSTPEGQKLKAQRLFDANDATEKVRQVADMCVGSFFAGAKDKARLADREVREEQVRAWLGGSAKAGESVAESVRKIRREHSPFHWPLEFPEVFYEDRVDPLADGLEREVAFMDGFIGNPPFAGKNTLAEATSASYPDWLKVVHQGAHGNADLSAHFFRRAAALLGDHGVLGFIATNTIAQGDTRITGIKTLFELGWQIYDASNSMPWPGAAAVTVCVVHAAVGRPSSMTEFHLDGVRVGAINSRLRPKPERPDALPLLTNERRAFLGTVVLGMGFTLTPTERDLLVERDPENADRIFPYLGGQEVNTSPTHDFDRYVISFGEMTLQEAEAWPDLLDIVRQKVKPERDRMKDNADGRRRKKHWWQFGRDTPALYAAIEPLDRCLVTLFTSKHLTLSLVPTKLVFANSLYVFPLDTYSAFAILQSRIHEAWARLLSSSLEDRLRYAASDCFDTFPFPVAEPKAVIAEVEAIGKRLYEARAIFMIDTDQGLTKTYNALKDPECEDEQVIELRHLHEAMDRAVLDAYGWSDITVPQFCPMNQEEEAALETFTDDVIDRLYLLNGERVVEEEQQGLNRKTSKKRATKSSSPPKKKGDPMSLPDMDTPRGAR